MKNENEKYCSECGQLISNKAEICPKCGVRQPDQSSTNNRWLTTVLLCFFLGYLGVHRFYTGHSGIGIIQLLTLGLCGVWTLIDFLMLLTGSYTDAMGNPIKNR